MSQELLKTIIDNYDEIKNLIINNDKNDLINLLKDNKNKLLIKKHNEAVEDLKDIIDDNEEYKIFESIVDKLENINYDYSEDSFDYLVNCELNFNFNDFNIELRYNGTDECDAEPSVIINNVKYMNVKMEYKKNILKIMRYFGFHKKDIKLFNKMLIKWISSYFDYCNFDFHKITKCYL